VVGRTLAMLGGDAAPAVPTFTAAQSVPNAGVLVAIPALIANGLYHELGEHLQSPRGFYGLPQLVLLLALLTVARVLSLERLRDEPCGEWGRLLGLDRIPEVRTLRAKIGAMVTPAGVAAWAESLGKRWMEDDPQLAGVLYVDGHVRAYHGDQTRLPERFSSRDRLCVRSLMDYYVCDRDGKPFFVVTAVGTEGMLYHLRTNISPRRPNWPPIPSATASSSSSTARATRPPSSPSCGTPTASPPLPTARATMSRGTTPVSPRAPSSCPMATRRSCVWLNPATP
jgi:prepilin-type processing-associated H-X9-DG protein